jgi:hypothetical protein
MTTTLPKPIQDYIDAGNRYDGDALIAAFADDALVNDNRREFWGVEAIRRWADQEIIGDERISTMFVIRNQPADH